MNGRIVALVLMTLAANPAIAAASSRGVVEMDGRDLREVSLASWLGTCAMVIQEPILFNASIRENIRYGRLEAPDGDVERAARLAGVHDEIAALPQGCDTVAGERGALLSGGRRQRVCIARALLRDPAVLILDEATSSLDSAAEARVREALDRAKEGRTSLVIAHRLSTVVSADRIHVLVAGSVEASGTHAELLDASPTCRELWTIQSGGGRSAMPAPG
jgi:ABC-type multidrug transport system fused ATPase/permease subunit